MLLIKELKELKVGTIYHRRSHHGTFDDVLIVEKFNDYCIFEDFHFNLVKKPQSFKILKEPNEDLYFKLLIFYNGKYQYYQNNKIYFDNTELYSHGKPILKAQKRIIRNLKINRI